MIAHSKWPITNHAAGLEMESFDFSSVQRPSNGPATCFGARNLPALRSDPKGKSLFVSVSARRVRLLLLLLLLLLLPLCLFAV